MVDDVDYDFLIKHKWHAYKHRDTFYAKRHIWVNGIRTEQGMHREILHLSHRDGVEVDHINRDGLDNQRSNLRITTHGLNRHNSKKNTNNISGYRGVHWCNSTKKWVAMIAINRKQKTIGRYRSVISAAEAYDQEAVKYYGSEAILNFPEVL